MRIAGIIFLFLFLPAFSFAQGFGGFKGSPEARMIWDWVGDQGEVLDLILASADENQKHELLRLGIIEPPEDEND